MRAEEYKRSLRRRFAESKTANRREEDSLEAILQGLRQKMKSIVLLCLIVASIYAGPPFPLSDDTLSPQCQTPKCPATKANDGAPIVLPYPLDCLQYIVCEESGPRTVACPADLVFNKNTGICDTRQNANCVPCWQG